MRKRSEQTKELATRRSQRHMRSSWDVQMSWVRHLPGTVVTSAPRRKMSRRRAIIIPICLLWTRQERWSRGSFTTEASGSFNIKWSSVWHAIRLQKEPDVNPWWYQGVHRHSHICHYRNQLPRRKYRVLHSGKTWRRRLNTASWTSNRRSLLRESTYQQTSWKQYFTDRSITDDGAIY